MRLIFIRHGETTGDIEDRYGGAYDDLLSPSGEEQARQLADELAAHPIEKIFCSPLRRAEQTAQELAKRVDCPVTTIEALRERDQYGPLTGMRKSEALALHPDLVEKVKNRLNTLPNAESYAAASTRMTKAYTDVLRQTKSCSAIVWHGGGMRALFRDILKMGELTEVGNCCWVDLEQTTPSSPFVIKQSRRIAFDFQK